MLREALGDAAVVELIDEFRLSNRALMDEIVNPQMPTSESLHRAVHSLKSSSAALGLMALSRLCANLELALRRDGSVETRAAIESLPELFTEAERWLLEQRPSLPTVA